MTQIDLIRQSVIQSAWTMTLHAHDLEVIRQVRAHSHQQPPSWSSWFMQNSCLRFNLSIFHWRLCKTLIRKQQHIQNKCVVESLGLLLWGFLTGDISVYDWTRINFHPSSDSAKNTQSFWWEWFSIKQVVTAILFDYITLSTSSRICAAAKLLSTTLRSRPVEIFGCVL